MQNVGYHMGLTKHKPRFDRYDYTEKLEYWALLWGTVVMFLTGLIMWFPAEAAAWLGVGKPWVDVSTVIHFYEAWLATLAILVWHLFFVIFHPKEYPMSTTWLTGNLSLEAMEERHPQELERLKAQGQVHPPSEDSSPK